MATTFVDVTYRGLKLQEKAKLVDDGGAAFLECELPLPVGTTVDVVADGVARPARVTGVVEHEAGANGQPAGMKLRWSAEAAPPPPEPPPEPVVEAAPVVEASSDDVSSPGDPDASGDGTPPTPQNGAPHPGAYTPGKKPRKSKRRR